MTKEERLQRETEKLAQMLCYEQELYQKGCLHIAGVDEVGRGPLAGPVVAAAVILPQGFSVLGIDDSKKLSEKKRELLYEEILKSCCGWGIGVIDNEVIDRINILEATKAAMGEALKNLSLVCKMDHVLIDALTLPALSLPQTGIIKGDSKSLSIAAASIVAKVYRDRMMIEWNQEYPGYGFDRNKGYGTAEHYEGIRSLGILPIHRRSFLRNVKI